MRYKNHKNRKLNIKEEGGVENMRKGFTLIELLIVIVIIGILAGAVLAVMNPAQQRSKANISVLRANLDKVCMAMSACAVSSTQATDCDTAADIGVDIAGVEAAIVGTNDTYTYANNAGVFTATATLTGAGPGGVDCVYECTHTYATGQSTPVQTTSAAGSCYNL